MCVCVSHEFQGRNYIVATVVSASVELSPVGMVNVVKACTKADLNSSGQGIVAIFSAENHLNGYQCGILDNLRDRDSLSTVAKGLSLCVCYSMFPL